MATTTTRKLDRRGIEWVHVEHAATGAHEWQPASMAAALLRSGNFTETACPSRKQCGRHPK